MTLSIFSERAKPIRLHRILSLAIMPWLVLLSAIAANAQTSSFTYQGRLNDGGTAATGNYDLQFGLWDSLSGGAQIGSTLTISTVAVSNGMFTVTLDFGAGSFTGGNRFLEIGVRPATGGSFTVLSPRQPITAAPYAIRTLSATTADNLSTACVTCVQDGQIGSVAGNKVQGTVASANTANSATTATNATTANGLSNACVNCVLDGQINSVGASKIVGTVANANTANSATSATNATTATNATQLGGIAAGQYVLTSDSRLSDARPPSPGSANYIQNSITQQTNSNLNISGNGIVGTLLGVGTSSPSAILDVVGPTAGCCGPTQTVLRVIGGNGTSDSSPLGNGAPGAQVAIQAGAGGNGGNHGGNGGDITLQPGAAGSGSCEGFGLCPGRAGIIFLKGLVDVSSNAIVRGAGTLGNNLGAADLQIGYGLGPPGTVNSVSRLAIQPYGHTSGPWIFRARDDAAKAYLDWVYGSATAGITQDSSGNIGVGTTSPTARLHVVGTSSLTGNVSITGSLNVGAGFISVDLLGGAGTTNLCYNASHQISLCSSSIRYKQNVNSFNSGLSLINRLRPVAFNWRADNKPDMGLVAEEVANVEPLLVTKNAKGEIEGVKYDRIAVVLINAVKEQQAQIEALRKTNAAMAARLKNLERSRKRSRK